MMLYDEQDRMEFIGMRNELRRIRKLLGLMVCSECKHKSNKRSCTWCNNASRFEHREEK